MPEVILSIYTRQDANVTLLTGNSVTEFIEIERLSRRRYFSFSEDSTQFAEEYRDYVESIIGDIYPTTVVLNRVLDTQKQVLRDKYPSAIQWIEVDHHLAHAWSAYAFTNPRENDVIVSFDGTRDVVDPFRVFVARTGEIVQLDSSPINLGVPCRILGILSPEVRGSRKLAYGENLGLAGKVMALAGFGSVRPEYRPALIRYYTNFKHQPFEGALRSLLAELDIEPSPHFQVEQQTARDLCATAQDVFETMFWENAGRHISGYGQNRLIFVGGCALNVILNRKIHESTGKDIFVPPCPNDSGSSLGAARSILPDFKLLNGPFIGLPLTDLSSLSSLAQQHNATTASAEEVAKLVLRGNVVGVVAGRAEAGPRALGHRSLLASPFIPGMRDKLNQIKLREPFRPVAPIVSIDQYPDLFCSAPASPYMSFAPILREQYREALREITHIDSTARVQTVGPEDGFIYKVVRTIGEETGYDIVMNTSLNSKGLPLVNTAADALSLMAETGIDYLLIENFLFKKGVGGHLADN